MTDVVLSTALRATLRSLRGTSNLIDGVTLRLASGLKVSSALDNPHNFFLPLRWAIMLLIWGVFWTG